MYARHPRSKQVLPQLNRTVKARRAELEALHVRQAEVGGLRVSQQPEMVAWLERERNALQTKVDELLEEKAEGYAPTPPPDFLLAMHKSNCVRGVSK